MTTKPKQSFTIVFVFIGVSLTGIAILIGFMILGVHVGPKITPEQLDRAADNHAVMMCVSIPRDEVDRWYDCMEENYDKYVKERKTLK